MSVSYFDQAFDVAVYGSGYAAYVAAMHLLGSGQRTILFHRKADLLWESGRAFAREMGDCDAPVWRELMRQIARRDAAAEGQVDGAIAEVLGASLVRRAGLPVLFYVAPVAAQVRDGMLQSLVLATKGGLRRLSASRWIDASETGELLRMVDPSLALRPPEAWRWRAFYQHADWPTDLPADLAPTLWRTERAVEIMSTAPLSERAIVRTLRSTRVPLDERNLDAVVSHFSFEPLPIYQGGAERAPFPIANVLAASPAGSSREVRTLGDRARLGMEAAQQIDACPRATDDGAVDDSEIQATLRIADVVVAGTGTGGALAAIAAGRAGASVLAFDLHGFPGGVGTGAGIHLYYHGVPGGLQEEVDERTRALAPLFGPAHRVRGFHPLAKKLALEQMMQEAGVQFIPDALLGAVERDGRRVRGTIVSTPTGVLDLRGAAWIDATGDGDLCAAAGASFRKGRVGDGNLHAFGQSSGRMQHGERGLTMAIVNYDAGWVDPTDSQDLTRSRLVGIAHYLCDPYTPGYRDDDRPTYIAPLLGIRQGRQIETDYVLTLADLIEHRRFDDAIALTSAHYDNHAIDYEFESDEAVFWVWVCRAWRTGKTACELPYRVMLPRELENVWIACRALGVSMDAHYSCRMQRDMQRLGEVAGRAAAMSAQTGVASRDVPIAMLQAALRQVGALRDRPIVASDSVGGIDDLRAGQATARLWHVYRQPERWTEEVAALLQSENGMTRWLAAGLLAMWNDGRAEPRLIHAIRSREQGPDGVHAGSHFAVPHWVIAITLLRMCGSAACLEPLQSLAADPSVPLNVRTAIALTIERLALRSTIAAEPALATLDALLAEPVPGAVVLPARSIIRPPDDQAGDPNPTKEDHRWQLHLAVARARRALGVPVRSDAVRWRADERSLVRQAFGRLLGEDETIAGVGDRVGGAPAHRRSCDAGGAEEGGFVGSGSQYGHA